MDATINKIETLALELQELLPVNMRSTESPDSVAFCLVSQTPFYELRVGDPRHKTTESGDFVEQRSVAKGITNQKFSFGY